MRTITLEELLEAGCHFGHQVTRHNPKSRDFVFEARDNIHIIDLAKTKEGLEEAGAFIKSVAQKDGSTILVVGTKRQAKPIIEEEIKRVIDTLGGDASIFSVTNRWIGGTLTNLTEVAKNSKKLKDLEGRLANEDEKEKYTKKEVGMWEKDRQKLEAHYGGVKNMKAKPDVLIIVDSHLENLAVREARATATPTVAIVDTNADPLVIDHPIPANDDAAGSIKLIVNYLVDAWIEGRKTPKEEPKETKETEETKETKEEKPKKKKVARSK